MRRLTLKMMTSIKNLYCLHKNEHYILNTNKDNLILTYNNDIVDFNLIKNCIIKNTAVELLEYPVLLLNQFYYDINGSNINVEIEDISKKHKKNY